MKLKIDDHLYNLKFNDSLIDSRAKFNFTENFGRIYFNRLNALLKSRPETQFYCIKIMHLSAKLFTLRKKAHNKMPNA